MTWDHKGKSDTRRGYGRQHAKQRAHLLAIEPLCRPCRAMGRVTAATIADHIIPLAQGATPYDFANLQPVCRDCHDRKTASDNGKRWKPRTGLDGWPEA